MSTTDKTVEEVLDSLTGFDEIAISKAFGFDPYAKAEEHPMLLTRALVFIEQKRGGDNDKTAHHTAMSMPMSEVNDYFADDDEIDPDEPETESGKDD